LGVENVIIVKYVRTVEGEEDMKDWIKNRYVIRDYIEYFLIHPAIVRLQNKYRDNRIHKIIFGVVFALFLIDLICRIWLGPNYKG
jgi:hypothetical protein